MNCNTTHYRANSSSVPGDPTESRRRNQDFPFRAKDIDAVLLSHAHIDHCGNLPNLVRHGFAGPIHCTPATLSLAGVMLADAAKIQQEDADYLNRKRDRGEPRIEPLYDERDVEKTLKHLQPIPYDTPTEISRGLEVTLVDAGHLLGSAMVALRMEGASSERRLTFTGDLGRPGLPILRDPSPIPPCDVLLSESTYGGHTHEPVEETAERLGEVVRQTAERGGKLLVPAFSLGRTQTIVYFLHQLMNAGRLPDIPIYVDSPMAARASEVFRNHPECFNAETLQLVRKHPELFGEEHIRYVRTVQESMGLNSAPGSCVIIAASGMCEAGRILHHLKHHIEDPNTTILIAGFQAPETLGRRLVERQPEVRILGRPYQRRAEVVVLNGLSSHADQGDLMRSLGPLAGTTQRVRLVHGEPERAEALAQALRTAGFADVAIPERGDTVSIDSHNP